MADELSFHGISILPGNYSNKQTTLQILIVPGALLNRRRLTSKNPGRGTQKEPIMFDVF